MPLTYAEALQSGNRGVQQPSQTMVAPHLRPPKPRTFVAEPSQPLPQTLDGASDLPVKPTAVKKLSTTELEDEQLEVLLQRQLKIVDANSDGSSICRPAYGANGSPVDLDSNHFVLHLTGDSDLEVHRYHIEITSTDNKIVRADEYCQLVRIFLDDHISAPLSETIVSDFRSNLYCLTKPAPSQGQWQIKYKNEYERTPSEKAKTFTLNLTYVATLPVSKYLRSLENVELPFDENLKEDIKAFLNIFIDHYARSQPLKFATFKSSCFDLIAVANQMKPSGGLEIRKGYFAALRVAAGRFLVNLNPRTKVFYRAIFVDVSISEWGEAHTPVFFLNDDAKRRLSLQQFLAGLRVVPVQGQQRFDGIADDHPRIKSVSGLADPTDGYRSVVDDQGVKSLEPIEDFPPRVRTFGAGPQDVEFYDKKAGDYISVLNYFKKHYPIFAQERLQDVQMPVINVGNKSHPVYLPCQACFIIPGQSFPEPLVNLTTEQQPHFTRASVRPPDENARSIVASGALSVGLRSDINPRMKTFGLELDKSLVPIKARRHEPPTLYGAYKKNPKMGEGVWSMSGVKFFKGAQMKRWKVLRILEAGDSNATTNSVRLINDTKRVVVTFKSKMNQMGLEVRSEPVATCLLRPQETTNLGLTNWFDKEVRGKDLHFLLVIKTTDAAPLYNQIKHLCDQRYGIHSSIMTYDTFFGPNPSGAIATNSPKINSKLGGINLQLESGSLDFIETDTMVVGLDVTHPPQDANNTKPSNRPLIAAMVASIEPNLAQWRTELRVQGAAKTLKGGAVEMATLNVRSMFVNFLTIYERHNKTLPKRILIYRDGLGVGQLDEVVHEELREMQNGCPVKYQPGALPQFTLVLCTKRHNVRAYDKISKPGKLDSPGADNFTYINPKNGTVIDRDIVETQRWNCWMQTHRAISSKSTARPGSYEILYDEILRPLARDGMNAQDLFEKVTNNMCYLFPRSTTAVSIPPATYLAHLACARAKLYLDVKWNISLVPPADTYPPLIKGGNKGKGTGSSVLVDRARARLDAWYQSTVQPAIEVHDALKGSMWYL
ncbi:uncharacterized protein KY384_006316 [Bacidia gigantensis]|uniref:uncharacterized protein n=1 Tax=Bacidia gigantensis TaxID=2732470 RepID=UPI001D04F80A|nr:uncharacterized protein KY384_006316 [Bacidia gigantensis]KAG8528629.1 hypothetical protein KY384_006316 [Bacidia gigantensis]